MPFSTAHRAARGRANASQRNAVSRTSAGLLLRLMLLPAWIATGTMSSAQPAAGPGGACEREMLAASRKHELPVSILYAVGLTETGRRGSLQPYALNIDGKAVFAADLAGGITAFETARRAGARFIDIGCMQINHRYHSRQFASLQAMFEPHQNVDYAARFLKQLKAKEGSWTLAVARYNAGPDNNPAQKRYVCAVIANMVASGFGSWTVNSKAFCNGK